ncbi:hypothetical protein ACQP2U_43600 (plasmid) [Nocardia sp. CA-084685]|uniref:hypothetical protein n=1 Tax=Nocardia sp. CA-084685 TaxID=3239970 RepID=UPI003D96A283
MTDLSALDARLHTAITNSDETQRAEIVDAVELVGLPATAQTLRHRSTTELRTLLDTMGHPLP